MKYLLDLDSCLNGYKVFYNTSNIDFYALNSDVTYISIPKGRSSPSLMSGANLFLKSKVKTIYNSSSFFSSSSSNEFIKFLNSEKAKEFVVVTKNYELKTICKNNNIKTTTLAILEKSIDFDEETYNKTLEEIKSVYDELFKGATTTKIIIFFFLISLVLVYINYETVLKFLSITIIIPLSLIISAFLFKIKKSYLLVYAISELVIGLILVFIVFNFYKDEKMDYFFKLFALMSAIFICIRSFSSIDNCAMKTKNRFSKFWNRLYN